MLSGFNNGIIIEFGIIYNSSNSTSVVITLPKAYNTYYIGVTDMSGDANNGGVTRFNWVSNSQFKMGWDVFVNVRINTTKFWITIGY